jgi:dTDP-4-amino-4,6-dideoxygalactose transaminase
LADGWLTTGDRTRAFETRFAEIVGVRHAVAVNSATAALHLALEGLGVGEGDEVIVPTYTFAASAEVVLYLRAKPVLVDVDEATLDAFPAAVAAAISQRTKGIEIVHLAGLPADIPAIAAAARVRAEELAIEPPAVVEDAAHAFPSPVTAWDGRYAGTIGRAGAFSFYATKTITTGEGGMLVTDNDDLADRARSMRLHGISRDAWRRYASSGSWYYEIEAAGFKYNPTDVASALGLVQLERASRLREARAAIAAAYFEGLADLGAAGRLILPAGGPDPAAHAWHLFVIRLTEADDPDTAAPGVAVLPVGLQGLATRRARVIDLLAEAGIGTSVHFIPLHLHPLYRRLGSRPGDHPVAERAYAGAISLPIWPGMTDLMVARVIDALRAALA